MWRMRARSLLWVVLFFIPISGGLYLLSYWTEVERLARTNPKTTALIEARRTENGKRNASVSLAARWRALHQISPHLQHAVVVAEDARFYQHTGFDWEAIVEAAERDWAAKSFRYGGSTISQQLVKNLYLSSEKSPIRKMKEALITPVVEAKLTKRRILEIYLNVVEWGEGIYGAEAASDYYFSKPAAELTPQEAAFLAAILPAPRYYQNHRATPYLQKRVGFILQAMEKRYPETRPTPDIPKGAMIESRGESKEGEGPIIPQDP
jgi:monofunctional biosynthetic peptidoglycan transglycosylase